MKYFEKMSQNTDRREEYWWLEVYPDCNVSVCFVLSSVRVPDFMKSMVKDVLHRPF